MEELNHRVEDPALWADAAAAQSVMRERNRLSSQIEGLTRLEREVAEAMELVELAEAEGDEAMVADGVAALRALATLRGATVHRAAAEAFVAIRLVE